MTNKHHIKLRLSSDNGNDYMAVLYDADKNQRENLLKRDPNDNLHDVSLWTMGYDVRIEGVIIDGAFSKGYELKTSNACYLDFDAEGLPIISTTPTVFSIDIDQNQYNAIAIEAAASHWPKLTLDKEALKNKLCLMHSYGVEIWREYDFDIEGDFDTAKLKLVTVGKDEYYVQSIVYDDRLIDCSDGDETIFCGDKNKVFEACL